MAFVEARNGDSTGGNPLRLKDYTDAMGSLATTGGFYSEGMVVRTADGAPIAAASPGYVQSISFGPLATLAKASGVCITLDCRTGDFVRRFAFEFQRDQHSR